MKRTHVIIAAALVVGMAVPVTVAHTEDNANACNKQADPCTPSENHKACKGDRNRLGEGGTQIGLILAEDPEEIGAYLDTRGDGSEDESLVDTPGILYVESNGFSDLQRSDWKCQSVEHEVDPGEWVEHPDQVVI